MFRLTSRLAIFVSCLGILLSSAQKAACQSDAEKIFGAIVQELERQSQKNKPKPQPSPGNPNNPGKVYPFPIQPNPGNSGTTGNIRIKNQSNSQLDVAFARPNGGGTYRKSVSPYNSYRRTGMAVGTTVTVSAMGKQQQFRLSGSNLSISVAEDGRMRASSSSTPPTFPINPGPINPGPPIRSASLNVSNLSLRTVSVQVVSNQGQGAFSESLSPGKQWSRSNLAVNSEVTISGRRIRSFRIQPGSNNAFITPDGSISISVGGRGSTPSPGPPSKGNRIEISNRSGQPISATYGTRTRSIQNRSGYTFVASPPGQIVSITGNGATATFVHRGISFNIRVRPNGQFLNLPSDAMVVQEGVSPVLPSPTPAGIGHALVLNQSSRNATYSYQEPGSTAQNLTIGPQQTIEWRPVPAGTSMTLFAGSKINTATIQPNQWTSLLVASNGEIAVKTTSSQHTPSLNPSLPAPTVTNLDTPPPSVLPTTPVPTTPGPLPSPSPNTPLVGVNASPNQLPTASVAPLTEAVVNNFTRKTSNETKQLVNSLHRAANARIEAIDTGLNSTGINTEPLVNAAKRGKLEEIVDLVHDLPTDQAKNSEALLNQLTAIAALQAELSPLKSKLAAGANSGVLLKRVNAISQQANNLGNSGLAAAMKRIQRDLTLQQTLLQGFNTAGLASDQAVMPQGLVNVISHPWIEPSKSYLGSNGMLLTGSADGFVTVAKVPTAQAMNLPVSSAGAKQPKLATTGADNSITITNPVANDETIQFRLNDKSYTVTAGQQLDLTADTNYIIEFRPNMSGEKSKFDVSKAGTYVFTRTDKIWSLGKRTIVAQISNPPNGVVSLNYLVDGKTETIAPGKEGIHTSDSSMIISFDQGNGSATINRVIAESGQFSFALASEEANKWDLYQGSPPASQDPASIAANSNAIRFERPSLDVIKASVGSELFDFSNDSTNAPTAPANSLIDALR